jgi:hypothetical protein
MDETLILVLDDNRRSYPRDEDLEWVVKDYGCRLVFADAADAVASGLERLARDTGHAIGAVLTDCFAEPGQAPGAVRRPFWHVEALRRARPDLLIGVHSGSLTPERERLAREAGANLCLRKGADLKPFYQKVAEHRQLSGLSALDRFWHDLPRLLETKFGKWVAYTSAGQCAEGDDQAELYRWCRSMGWRPGTYVVARVLPDQPVAVVPNEWVGA